MTILSPARAATAQNILNITFHKDATIKDPDGLLEGDGKEARTARFYDMEDREEKTSPHQGNKSVGKNAK